jgi:hypothetical protein
MKVFPSARAILLTSLMLSLLSTASAQERPPRRDVWDLKIGQKAEDLPADYVDFACGTNGGPPSILLKGFTDFARCKPDKSGLHEVYFRYDDELEYWARALGLELEIRRFQGTQIFDFPVIVSALIDDNGILQGIRIVTDPREEIRDRIEFWTLANFLRNNFGAPGWECTDLPRADGETPVGTRFVKQHCEKLFEGKRLILENHFYRRPGQVAVNEHTGEAQRNSFESSTRFEYYAADFHLSAQR